MTIHLNHSGHISLDNGAVIRLDAEVGRWAARFYGPDRSLSAYRCGSFEEMCATANMWADAFEASMSKSSTGGGEARRGPDDNLAGPRLSNPLGDTA